MAATVGVELELGAASRSLSCCRLVALTIGAVIDLRWISHASATVTWLELCFLAVRIERLQHAEALGVDIFLHAGAARALAESASDRYLPVKNPPASG